MGKPISMIFYSLVIQLTLFGCTSSHQKASESQKTNGGTTPTWAAKMHSLSITLSNLLPLVSSPSKFSDDKNLPRIESNVRDLRLLAHGLNNSDGPNADPGMRIMSVRFEEDVDRALENLQAGNRDYARNILKDTTAYCIQCHTATQNGPEFPHLDLKINMAELSPIERAEFYAATRQFDSSLAEYEKILKSESIAKSNPFDWERATRSTLAIIVRVKNNPQAVGQMIKIVRSNKQAPRAAKAVVALWSKSVKQWKKEKRSAFKSLNDQLAFAEVLLGKAQRQQEFPLDHSQDVLFFRASSLLSDLLAKHSRKDELSAKALYLAGIAAQATRDMNFWTLHETYFERCIETLPWSEVAQQCYGKLDESITLGYSGSGGTRIPPEVKRHLDHFKAMAIPSSNSTLKKTN
jgi:hypothetical protein